MIVKNRISVSEVFYSLQGEGQTMGIPAIFLRLSGCNLLCKSKDWICDSIEVWKKGKMTDYPDVIKQEWITRLKEGAHLVITGGEPLLHQDNIVRYLHWLEQTYGFKPIIEVETNGTIEPNWGMMNKVKYWNVSPKLANSGESFKKRINTNAIHWLNEQSNTIFKFVIKERDDILGIMTEYNVPMNKVWLMPAGSSHDELNETRKMVAETAIQMGVRYTERIHVNIWNKATGV